MKHKILTDKQLLYIYNTVIIPKLEYRTQLSCLTKNDCFNLQSPYRTLFKHKLKLSKTCPNSILFNRLLYNFRDLYDVTLQSKISQLYIQINDRNLLGLTTQIRLKQIQDE